MRCTILCIQIDSRMLKWRGYGNAPGRWDIINEEDEAYKFEFFFVTLCSISLLFRFKIWLFTIIFWWFIWWLCRPYWCQFKFLMISFCLNSIILIPIFKFWWRCWNDGDGVVLMVFIAVQVVAMKMIPL